MKKIALLVLGACLAAALGAGVASAAGRVGDHDPAPEETRGSTEGVTLGEAPTTRVAVYVDGLGPGSSSIRRVKGVTFVSNPQDGTFCIRSNVSGFHPAKVFPVVSVDYSQSEVNGAAAQWRSGRPFCPAGTIEIFTFDLTTGLANNTTAFTVVVP
jgi:hypothetical protein